MQDVEGAAQASSLKVMDDDQSAHDATLLLQEFLQLSDQFTRMLSEELSVNATDFQVMEHLLRAGSLTPGELAQRLGTSGAAMTTAVDRLVTRGHVSRHQDSEDRRRVRVVPTPASSDRAASFITPMVRALDAQLDGFSTADQRVITEYLRAVVTTLREHARATTPETMPDGPHTGKTV